MMKRLACTLCLALWVGQPALADTIIIDNNNQTGSINGAVFSVFNAKGAGSGNMNAFLRIHETGKGSPGELGYNTGNPRGTFPAGFPDLDQVLGNFTYNLQLGTVPKVTIGNTDYRQLILDLNEPGGQGQEQITLEQLLIFVGPNDNVFIDGDLSKLIDNGPFGKLIYDLDNPPGQGGSDNKVIMTDLFSGSGSTDVQILIPEALFTNQKNTAFFTVFANFSGAQGGFEEFLNGPDGGGGGPGPGGGGPPIPPPPGSHIPEPASVLAWLLVGWAGYRYGGKALRKKSAAS